MKTFYSPDNQNPEIIPNEELWEWVSENIVSKRNAIDIGAHIGTMAYRMGKRFKEVHAFEPAFYDWTNKNLEELDNVTVHPFGLGNEDKTEHLYVMENKVGGSSIVPTAERKRKWIREDTEKREINITTLDRFNFTDVDFIKIDVESYEWFVLDGARKTLTRESPMIMIEFLPKHEHPIYPSQKSKQLLNELGYIEILKHQLDHIFVKKSDKIYYAGL